MNQPDYRFCKAYPAERVLKYQGVAEHLEKHVAALRDRPVVYLHDDFVIRSGVFLEDDIIYSDTTDRWKEFCSTELGFGPPEEPGRADAPV
jgi:hypothetical protein